MTLENLISFLAVLPGIDPQGQQLSPEGHFSHFPAFHNIPAVYMGVEFGSIQHCAGISCQQDTNIVAPAAAAVASASGNCVPSWPNHAL